MKNIYHTLEITKACLVTLALSLVTVSCSDLLDKEPPHLFLMVAFGQVKEMLCLALTRMLSFPDRLVA